MPDTTLIAAPDPERLVCFKELADFRDALGSRLLNGSHLILYGPRGSGKSSLLTALCNHYRSTDVPCGMAPQTSGLPDVVTALTQAYPGVNIDGIGKRGARARLWRAADCKRGVLLLDHASAMTTAMLGFLRRLRGGIAGTLLVADVDSEAERMRMRSWHAGALSVRMPLITNKHLAGYLVHGCYEHNLPELQSQALNQIVRAARGRIGWTVECIRRLALPEYWQGHHLLTTILCTDCEIAVRQNHRGPRITRRSLFSSAGVLQS